MVNTTAPKIATHPCGVEFVAVKYTQIGNPTMKTTTAPPITISSTILQNLLTSTAWRKSFGSYKQRVA